MTEWVALVSEFGVKFPHLVAQHPSLLVDVWAHWDVGYYLGLAQHGYVGPASPPNGIAFGPLYPWAIRLVHVVTGLGWVASAELWSVGALVLGLAALIHLVSSIRNGPTADAAVVLLVAWPTAFFLLVPTPSQRPWPSSPGPWWRPATASGSWPGCAPPEPASPSTTW